MSQLAIIGAGLAGLAAARALRTTRPDIQIVLFEKSRGLGGRAATRRRDGCVFDHGAQLFKLPSAALQDLVLRELPAADLITIPLPVWTFAAAGTVSPGDPQQNAEPSYGYSGGMSTLGRLLGAGLEVRKEVRVARIVDHRPPTTDHRPQTERIVPSVVGGESSAAGASAVGRQPSVVGLWQLFAENGEPLGSFDAVLFTAPAPQTAEILRASDLDPDLRDRLLAALAPGSYRRCLSVTLAYPTAIERPFYALVNADKAHPVSWLALEHAKGPGRCPPGHSLVTLQFAPQFSADHWEQTPDALIAAAAGFASALLGADLGAPLWGDRQGWRYALPDGRADFDALNGTGSGLFFAGDFSAGLGRVHLAIEQGWRVARRAEAFARGGA